MTTRANSLLNNRFAFTCLAAGMALAPLAHGDGFRNPPGSAEGLGHVGSRYALIDDASASAYNPANLMGVEKPDLLLSVTMALSDKDYTSPAGDKAEVKEKWYLMPDAYLAWPLAEQRAVAAIGITTPYGQATEYDKDSVFRYTAPYYAQLRSINVNPTLAFRLGDSVDVGVGADILWSDIDIRQTFPWAAVTGDPATPDGTARFEGDGVGFGGHAGLTWRVTERQRVGLVYRSAVDVDYEGDSHFSRMPPGLGLGSRSDFDTSIEFPNMIAFGYGIDVTEKLTLGIDIEWFEWSSYESLALDAGDNAALVPTPTIPQNWEDTWNFGIGGRYALNEAWTLRAGYIFLETPVPEETMLPALAENDQHVITVGLGYTEGSHRFDIAYGLGLYEDRDVENNQNPAYNGTYEFLSHLVALSYGRTF